MTALFTLIYAGAHVVYIKDITLHEAFTFTLTMSDPHDMISPTTNERAIHERPHF